MDSTAKRIEVRIVPSQCWLDKNRICDPSCVAYNVYPSREDGQYCRLLSAAMALTALERRIKSLGDRFGSK